MLIKCFTSRPAVYRYRIPEKFGAARSNFFVVRGKTRIIDIHLRYADMRFFAVFIPIKTQPLFMQFTGFLRAPAGITAFRQFQRFIKLVCQPFKFGVLLGSCLVISHWNDPLFLSVFSRISFPYFCSLSSTIFFRNPSNFLYRS